MPEKMQTKPSKRSVERAVEVPVTRWTIPSGSVNARVEPRLKRNAEAILDRIGLSITDAVTLFLTEVIAHKGMPFPVKIPNRDTTEAMRELENGGGTRHEGDIASVFASILQPRAGKS